MSMQNTSLKKMNPKLQFQKSKTNKLLLTDFNKFSLFNYSLKQSKKKLNITNQTNTNNSLKNQKNINTSNNNTNTKNNYLNNISNNNTNEFTLKNQKKISNTSKNELKQILYNNNTNNKSIKYNSVNNLIGINISVNYLNKNYTLNKTKQPNFCTSIYSNYSSKNLKNNQNQKKGNIINDKNDNYYNKYISESFNENNRGNNSYFNSSGKNRINKKKRFIMNPTQNDFQNIIDNLKYKSINKNNNNSVNKMQNQIEIKNTISSTDENNNNSNNNKVYFNSPRKIVGIGKSFSCKHMNNNNSTNNNDNIYQNHRYKDPGNKNIYKVLMTFLDKKISKLKDNIINNNNKEYTDDEKLYDIINEFFIKYCNSLDDQFQKELIVNIFYLINNIINRRDKQILILKKEKENLMEKSNLYLQNNEELMEQNNSLINKCDIMQNKIEELNSEIDMYKKDLINKKKENNLKLDIKLNNNNNISSDNNEENSQHLSSSSYVNTEELESIRFFDKIEMKKHSFLNIPELSFQKIKLDELNRDKKPIKKKNSFQTKNPYIKKTKNNMDNIKRINKKIVYCNNSNILPKYKQKLNMNHRQNINLSGNKISSINISNKPNNIGCFFVPDFKKGVEVKKAK